VIGNAQEVSAVGVTANDKVFLVIVRQGQGDRKDASMSVPVAGLEGHVSRSAVYLVHKEVRTSAGWKRAEEVKTLTRGVLLRKSDAIIRRL